MASWGHRLRQKVVKFLSRGSDSIDNPTLRNNNNFFTLQALLEELVLAVMYCCGLPEPAIIGGDDIHCIP